MSRRWTDPRDGTQWLIEALPFDAGPTLEADAGPLGGWTIVFASGEGHRELPVGFELGTELTRLGDREIIALLDASWIDDRGLGPEP